MVERFDTSPAVVLTADDNYASLPSTSHHTLNVFRPNYFRRDFPNEFFKKKSLCDARA